ncbi:hypothetical protein J6590_059650 [Homalodisca vitripennis]|nr:hypothetical protein J6590_059650 [Homalodisca vitripennis]
MDAFPGEMQLLPGEYVYPFTTTLPTILPSSFESEHGKIRYFIKAKVEIPWGVDFKVEKTFNIKTNVDLNNIAEAKKPIKRQVEKTFCCMWCRSGPLTMVLNLPQAGYVPGQNIPVILEVDNASNVDVDNVVIKLQKRWRSRWMLLVKSRSMSTAHSKEVTNAAQSSYDHCQSSDDSDEMSVVTKWWLIGNIPNRRFPVHPINLRRSSLGEYHHLFLELKNDSE